MLSRFSGPDGERRVKDLIMQQAIVNGHVEIADELFKKGKLVHYRDIAFIEQDGTDTEIYFILVGSVDIIINKSKRASRKCGQHVGEMALIDISAKRSASVYANGDVICLTLIESDFSKIADAYPILWRRLSIELSKRLLERNSHFRVPNTHPTIFIGSSSESIPILRMVQNSFSRDPFILRPWTVGVFKTSSFPLDDLLQQVTECDFAIMVVKGEDMVISRGSTSPVPRDNIIFETGLFMGALGRSRTFMLSPNGVDLKLPSDLAGLTCESYNSNIPANLNVSVSSACNELRKLIIQTGMK